MPSGGNLITEALVDYLGLSWPDAERLKRETADAMPPAGAEVNGGAANEYAATGVVAPTVVAAPTPPRVAPSGTTVLDNPATTTMDETPTEAGGDWSDFDSFGAAPTDAIAAPTSAAPTSSDPFDLDFFDQGPQNTEPPEQHGQQEKSDFDALFEDDGEASLPGRDSSPASSEPDTETQELPAVAGQTQAATPIAGSGSTPASNTGPLIPSAFDFSFDDDENDDVLPAVSGSQTRDIGAKATMTEDDEAPAPIDFTSSAPDTAAPIVEEPVSGTPISFEFAGSEPAEELPARGVQISAPETAPLAVGAMAAGDTLAEAELPAKVGDFDFDAAPSPATTPDLTASQAGATSNDLDLNELFGDSGATSELSAEPSSAGETTTFDAGELGAMGETADTGMDFDLATFGAGLTDEGVLTEGVDAATLYSIVQPALENLVGEVRRSLEYHASRAPDSPVRRVVLIGGGAKLKNIDAYFTQSLGMPATIGDPLAHVTVDVPRLGEQYATENSPSFAVALGLAMGELS